MVDPIRELEFAVEEIEALLDEYEFSYRWDEASLRAQNAVHRLMKSIGELRACQSTG